MEDDEAARLADEIERVEREVRRRLTPQEMQLRLDTIRMLIEVSAHLRMIAEDPEY